MWRPKQETKKLRRKKNLQQGRVTLQKVGGEGDLEETAGISMESSDSKSSPSY